MPVKYVPFVPERVKGQAVLQNFNRVLRYKGADDTAGILERGMPLYEVEKQETAGKDESGNLIIRARVCFQPAHTCRNKVYRLIWSI